MATRRGTPNLLQLLHVPLLGNVKLTNVHGQEGLLRLQLFDVDQRGVEPVQQERPDLNRRMYQPVLGKRQGHMRQNLIKRSTGPVTE